MIVYKVISPSNKVYIGITSYSLKRRKMGHECAARTGSNTKFHKAIRKYGDSMQWSIAERVSSFDHAKKREIDLIKFYDSFEKGYNSTLGGDGKLGIGGMLGKRHSDETKKKIGKSNSKPKPNGFGEKISKLHTGRSQTKQHINTCLKARNCRPFYVLKNDIIIGEYINQSACARQLNLRQDLISGCLNTPERNKSHKGYTFRYKD